MIPSATVRTFLAEKTQGYTPYLLPIDTTFRAFLAEKYSEISSTYTFRNSIVSIPNMKKYGVKFVKNIVTNGSDSKVFLTFLHEKKKTQFFLMCGKISGATPDLPYWKESTSKDSEIVASNRARFTTIRDYVQKDQYSYLIFDTKTPCVLVPSGYINPKKDGAFIAELERFFDEGVGESLPFDTSGGFVGSLFSTASIPRDTLIVEYPSYTGKSNIDIYLRNSL